jgi:hypothetical protein
MCIRLKKNCKDTKKISLIGQGFQAYLDHRFWYLPFSTPKQAHNMLAKKEISDKPWTIKRDEIKAEHLLEQAPADLRMGWKAWIADQGSGKEGSGAAAAIPAAGITLVIRDQAGALCMSVQF